MKVPCDPKTDLFVCEAPPPLNPEPESLPVDDLLITDPEKRRKAHRLLSSLHLMLSSGGMIFRESSDKRCVAVRELGKRLLGPDADFEEYT